MALTKNQKEKPNFAKMGAHTKLGAIQSTCFSIKPPFSAFVLAGTMLCCMLRVVLILE
jgi:hypothetical protein